MGSKKTEKRYLLVLSSMEIGGAERQAINFAAFLKDNRRDVTILGLTDNGAVYDFCEERNIRCETLHVKNDFAYVLLGLVNKISYRMHYPLLPQAYALYKYIEKGNFDICISYCTLANTWLGLSRYFGHSKTLVWYQRDAGIFDSREGYQAYAIRKMDILLSNSWSGYTWLKEAYDADSDIIYNGAVLKEALYGFKEWRENLSLSDDKIMYTMIANLSSAKDHMLLLRAYVMSNIIIIRY